MNSMADLDSQKILSALVRAGLAEFAFHSLGEELPLFTRLKAESTEIVDTDWLSFKNQLAADLHRLKGKTGVFIQDTRLPLHELFIFSLLGEMEASHLINLAVSQLQAPVENSRPSCFLCAALVELLFSMEDYNSQDLYNSQLHTLGLIRFSGEGPLPQHQLSCSAELWQILKGKSVHRPTCQSLTEGTDRDLLPLKTQAEINNILPVLQDLAQSGKGTVLLVRGKTGSGRHIAVNIIAQALNLKAHSISETHWQKQSDLPICCHYANWLPVIQPDIHPGQSWKPRLPFLSGVLIIVMGQEGSIDTPAFIELKIDIPAYQERLDFWQHQLDIPDNSACLASARLSHSNIKRIAETARINARISQSELTTRHLLQARRQYGIEKLRLLAEPISLSIEQNDLVLSRALYKELQQLIERCRKREQLADDLGHIIQATLNPGIRSLFCGPSGTGKTLCASYIAGILGSPLYRVDISAIMNKYIGETEKNLSLLLEHASASDAILLFDEADSLFGRRNHSDNSSERFANMITNFLLSRIESHDGIVLLTTNNQQDIDPAFIRRFDMILDFPLPTYEQRYQLWQKHLGEAAATSQYNELLANYCDLSGGHIRNAVLNAALEAGGQPIQLQHILSSLDNEYRKLGRSMPASLQALASGASL